MKRKLITLLVVALVLAMASIPALANDSTAPPHGQSFIAIASNVSADSAASKAGILDAAIASSHDIFAPATIARTTDNTNADSGVLKTKWPQSGAHIALLMIGASAC